MTPDAKKFTLAERIGGVFLGGIAFLAILVLVLPFVLGGNVRVILQLGTALLAGWFKFFERTLAAIEWNWPMMVLWGLCFLAVGVGLDRFLKWFSSFVADKRGQSFIWPTRWTWSALAAVGIFFAVGMSVGGVLHQVGWLAGSEEPMVVVRSGRAKIAEMKQIDGALQQALLESKDDCEKARQTVWSYLKYPETLQKQYRLFVLVDTNGKATGNIIFPLNQQDFQQSGGLVYIEGDEYDGFVPMEKVKSLLHNHRDKLRQF